MTKQFTALFMTVALGLSAMASTDTPAIQLMKAKKSAPAALAPLENAESLQPPPPAAGQQNLTVARSVKVSYGDDHDFNVRFGALSLLIGMVNADANIATIDSLSVGPSINYWSASINETKFRFLAGGVRGNYYMGRPVFSQGWYLGPFVEYIDLKLEDKFAGIHASGEASGWAGGAIVGYNWIWDNFNINLGMGGMLTSVDHVEVHLDDGSSKSDSSYGTSGGLTGEFTLGWAF